MLKRLLKQTYQPLLHTALLTACLLLAACHKAPDEVRQHPANNPPQRLSAWALLTLEAGTLTLNKDVLAYDLNTPLFTDYAQKLRTLWLPPGTAATYTPVDSFDFPVGTIISKTFYYPLHPDRSRVVKMPPGMPGFKAGQLDLSALRLIETRLLIHQADGWQALPYVWNNDQSEAFLQISGDVTPLQLAATRDDNAATVAFDYIVPDANQCAGCHATDHSAGEPLPIGPKARHLNREFQYRDGTYPQLEYWRNRGYLAQLPAAPQRPRNARWVSTLNPAEHIDAAQLTQHARSYLDINCAHCHSATGAADTSGLFLEPDVTDPRRLGVCKPPVAAGRGSGGHRYAIVPGLPQQSIFSFRIASTDPGEMMPELGRNLSHQEGLALINAWIAQLPGSCQQLGG